MQGTELLVNAPAPRYVPKPWGHELWFAHTDAYAGKLLHVRAGHRLFEREIGPGVSWRNEPGLVHTIEALEAPSCSRSRPRSSTMSSG
jgi:hypothetical protein